MNIEQALQKVLGFGIEGFIERAVKGGYPLNIHDWRESSGEEKSTEQILLDPAAWVAVGKVEGWQKKIVIRRGMVIGNFCTPCSAEHPRGECFEEMGFGMDYLDPWVYHMHRFIDYICEGATIEQ